MNIVYKMVHQESLIFLIEKNPYNDNEKQTAVSIMDFITINL